MPFMTDNEICCVLFRPSEDIIPLRFTKSPPPPFFSLTDLCPEEV